MDIFGKLVWVAMIMWISALAVGLIIALMPVFLAVAGFVLAVAVFAFIGRLIGSWLGY